MKVSIDNIEAILNKVLDFSRLERPEGDKPHTRKPGGSRVVSSGQATRAQLPGLLQHRTQEQHLKMHKGWAPSLHTASLREEKKAEFSTF